MRFSARDFVKTLRSALDLDVDSHLVFVLFRVLCVYDRAARMANHHGYNLIETILVWDLVGNNEGQRSIQVTDCGHSRITLLPPDSTMSAPREEQCIA